MSHRVKILACSASDKLANEIAAFHTKCEQKKLIFLNRDREKACNFCSSHNTQAIFFPDKQLVCNAKNSVCSQPPTFILISQQPLNQFE